MYTWITIRRIQDAPIGLHVTTPPSIIRTRRPLQFESTSKTPADISRHPGSECDRRKASKLKGNTIGTMEISTFIENTIGIFLRELFKAEKVSNSCYRATLSITPVRKHNSGYTHSCTIILCDTSAQTTKKTKNRISSSYKGYFIAPSTWFCTKAGHFHSKSGYRRYLSYREIFIIIYKIERSPKFGRTGSSRRPA